MKKGDWRCLASYRAGSETENASNPKKIAPIGAELSPVKVWAYLTGDARSLYIEVPHLDRHHFWSWPRTGNVSSVVSQGGTPLFLESNKGW